MSLKNRLNSGKTAFGVISPLAHPALVELAAISNFDFYILDGEVGALTPANCESAILAAKMLGITMIVRVHRNEPAIINQYLDLGASGIVVPHISSAEAARKAVSAARYHPEGNRGLGPCRANNYAINTSLSEYIHVANRETLVIVQIEDADAIDKCDQIASVAGIDGILVGPRDLALSMGCIHERDKSALNQATDHIITTGRTCGVPVCLPAAEASDAAAVVQRGAGMVLASLLTLLHQGMSRFLETKQ